MHIGRYLKPLDILLRSESKYFPNQQLDEVAALRNNLEMQRAIAMPISKLDSFRKTDATDNLIVSMTSTYDRLETTFLALRSVFQMIYLPNRVVLWLDQEAAEYALKSPLYEPLLAAGLSIRAVVDVGPLTKIHYALQEFPESTVVTFDDDIIYPLDALSNLVGVSRVHRGAVVGNWARRISSDASGQAVAIPRGKLLTPPFGPLTREKGVITAPSMRTFAYGTGGVLYPPKSLDSAVDDLETYSRLCFNEDDVWLKAMSYLAGTPVVAAPYGFSPSAQTIFAAQHRSLRSVNHSNGFHEEQLRRTFKYFGIRFRK